MVFVYSDGSYVVGTKGITAALEELNKRVDFDTPGDPMTVIFTPMRNYLANMQKQGLTAYHSAYVEAMNAHLHMGLERVLKTQECLDAGVRPGLVDMIGKTQKIGRLFYDYSNMGSTPQFVRQVINHYDRTMDAIYTVSSRAASPSPTAVTEGKNSHTGVVASPTPERTL